VSAPYHLSVDHKLACYRLPRYVLLSLTLALAVLIGKSVRADSFIVEEASIGDIHQAINKGDATCQSIVQAYLDRAKAYNGVCTRLVTQDGKPAAAATGYMRAGAPIQFPTQTFPVASLLPEFDKYSGMPLDLGRMDTTASDPSVVQQFGMVVGWQKAGQLNALETLNIRGERSVACKAECDLHPSKGALLRSCPAGCETFRKLPDALERAAELDAQFGKKPDLKKLPLYCATVSIKNWYDVKDMRSTGGNDVKFALDAPPRDSTVVAAIREKGAIIFAISIAAEVGNSAEGAVPQKNFVGGSGSIRSSWGGHVCNPYDTERAAGPSSGGAGVSVAANLVTFAICETTGGSCREPANQNAVTSIVTTKGLMSEYGTATAQYLNHRPGIIARTLADGALVLDAINRPADGYFDPRDGLTAIPKVIAAQYPFSQYLLNDNSLKKNHKPLAGMRIGIVREFMVKHTPNDAAITDRVDEEIKKVLRDQLGAELVESVDPKFPDDPDVANMDYTFQEALAETIAIMAPEYLQQMLGETPEFAVPGYDVLSQDYRVKLALGQAPISPALNMRRIQSGLDDGDRNDFSMAKYLAERQDPLIKTWADYAAHAKWRSYAQAAGAEKAVTMDRSKVHLPEGMDRVKMHTVFRYAILKAMQQNRIDVFVHPNVGVPQWKIGIDREPTVDGRRAAGPSITDLIGVPEIIVPAGFDDVVYEPQYVLNPDKKNYTLVTGKTKSQLATAMPFSINFWAGPGDEPILLKAASAYESATHHRVPPKDFGPLR
jgi:amidase